MQLTLQLAKHLRDVHFGGNWTTTNQRDVLSDVSWQEAKMVLPGMNSIVALVYHMNYFVDAQLRVLQGKPLDAKDAYSFDHSPIHVQEDWDRLLAKVWHVAEAAALLIEALPDEKLAAPFVEEKYGHYFRNIIGNIEHLHYHLGQIVVIKKMIRNNLTHL